VDFNQRSIDNLKGVHPDLVKVLTEAIKTSPCDFVITDGVRTTAEQQELYAKGRTKPGSIVTYRDGIKSKSEHQVREDGFGYAVDLYPFFDGKLQLSHKDTPKMQRLIANHIKSVGHELGIEIIAGIDFKKPFDPPHFELKK